MELRKNHEYGEMALLAPFLYSVTGSPLIRWKVCGDFLWVVFLILFTRRMNVISHTAGLKLCENLLVFNCNGNELGDLQDLFNLSLPKTWVI